MTTATQERITKFKKALKTQSNLTTKLPTAQVNEGDLVLLDF